MPVSIPQLGLDPKLCSDTDFNAVMVGLLKPMHFPEISVRIQVKAYIGIGVIHIQVVGHTHKRKPLR